MQGQRTSGDVEAGAEVLEGATDGPGQDQHQQRRGQIFHPRQPRLQALPPTPLGYLCFKFVLIISPKNSNIKIKTTKKTI